MRWYPGRVTPQIIWIIGSSLVPGLGGLSVLVPADTDGSCVACSPPLPFSQQYVQNVLHRANDEVGNLRANHRLRESLDNYTWPIAWPAAATAITTKTAIYSAVSGAFSSNIDSGGTLGGSSGVIGILADLVTIPDVRIARALSFKRRAALSTVIVDNDKVLFDFRRRGIHTGPVNFLPVSTLLLDDPTPLAPLLLLPPARNNASDVVAPNEETFSNARGDGGVSLLPPAPEAPAPAGFLGYAVRLLQLRPEHESLRWTVLYALFKDLTVFETTEQVITEKQRSSEWYGILVDFSSQQILRGPMSLPIVCPPRHNKLLVTA